MRIGVDYYPEHWERSRWEKDAQLMKEGGFNVVRLAEFAWVLMEPEEGCYEFGWLDDALEILGKHGISALLCTPTAAMPAWTARKYPETLATQADGTRIKWGARKNNCFTSGTYRLLSERITRAMAGHFSGAPNVIGWQTDNEFARPFCYCNSCRTGFQDWLKAKYGSLDRLNAAWGARFWSHVIGRWEDITIPDDETRHNPGACLDWRRYHSFLNVRFQKDQIRILRGLCPGHFITHNFLSPIKLNGRYAKINYYDLAEDLDFASWDNYVVQGKPEIPYFAASGADVIRGVKGKNFWIMEQTAGAPGDGCFGRNPWPGEIRKTSWQQAARGADGQLWFRWRTCTSGREQYWHGLLGHDGRPLRRYNEAARTALEYRRLAPEIEGTSVKSEAAFIFDFDSIWALEIQPGFPENSYVDGMHRYYDALFRVGVNVDMVKPSEDFSKYRAVFAPGLHVLPVNTARSLVEYVKNGGVLLADCRTGVKDENNLCHKWTLPGELSQALGIEIEEYESLQEEEKLKWAVPGSEENFTAQHYADWVRSRGAETLAFIDHKRFRGMPAVTFNTLGRGGAYYAGTRAKEPGFYDRLVADILARAGITPPLPPPEGVEVSVREGSGRRLFFIINHTDMDKTIKVPEGDVELISGKKTGKTLALEPFGIALIKQAW